MRSQNCEERLLASSCLSVRPTTRIPVDIFSLNLIFEYYCENLSKKIKFHENLTRITDTLLEDQYTFLIISLSALLKIRNVLDKVVQEIERHISCSVFFFFEIRSVYEIAWKNTVLLGRPQMTMWRLRISCSIPKATNTFSEYVILIAFPLQQWSHE